MSNQIAKDMTAEEAAELERLEKKLAKDIAEKRKEFEIGRKCPKTSADRMVSVYSLYGSSGTVIYQYGDFGRTWIQYLGMSDAPTHPQGFSQWGEMEAHKAAAYRYASGKERIRWLDLPEHIRKHVIARATES